MWKRVAAWSVALVAGLVLLLLLTFTFIDEPLRRYLEGQWNQRVEGYTFHIGNLNLRLVTLGVELEDVTFRQKEHPDPPIARIPKWVAGIHWRNLLSGNLVSDHRVERPVVQWTRAQAKEAKKDLQENKAEVRRRWQEVVESIYPMTINEFTVTEAEITYLDDRAATPIRLKPVDLHVTNVKNVKAKPDDYPSDVHLEAQLDEGGRIRIDGSANLFATPYPAVNAEVALHGLPLGQFASVLSRYHVQLRQGVASAEGLLEYSPWMTRVDLRSLALKDAKLDYVDEGDSEPARRKGKKALDVAQDTMNRPGLVLKIRQG